MFSLKFLSNLQRFMFILNENHQTTPCWKFAVINLIIILPPYYWWPILTCAFLHASEVKHLSQNPFSWARPFFNHFSFSGCSVLLLISQATHNALHIQKHMVTMRSVGPQYLIACLISSIYIRKHLWNVYEMWVQIFYLRHISSIDFIIFFYILLNNDQFLTTFFLSFPTGNKERWPNCIHHVFWKG